MLIPRYWADHGEQRKFPGRKQASIRRAGWSMQSQEDAERHARERVAEVWGRWDAKRSRREKRRELRSNYGLDGVPIREEIVEEYPDLGVVITRNVYGARCLNVPDVLFADIDLDAIGFNHVGIGCFFVFLALVVVLPCFIAWQHIGIRGFLPFAVLMTIAIAEFLYASWRKSHLAKHPESALKSVRRWCTLHSTWRIHVYRTPAGYRLLATHAPIDPRSDEAQRFARAIHGDPKYRLLCVKQDCFRARLSPKPWRMGLGERYGRRVWPWPTEQVAARASWVAGYEIAALGYAACEFVTTIGGDSDHPRTKAVRDLHDRLCQVGRNLPLA
jgi:hypothetical protein